MVTKKPEAADSLINALAKAHDLIAEADIDSSMANMLMRAQATSALRTIISKAHDAQTGDEFARLQQQALDCGVATVDENGIFIDGTVRLSAIA